MLLASVSFFMCIIWIYAVAGELVALLNSMGLAVGANSSLLGLSLLAWGNSVGDLVNNVSVAKAGFPTMGLAACVAGPVFNLLMGLGVSMLVLTGRSFPRPVPISFDRYTMTASLLILFVLLFLLAYLALGFRRLSRWLGIALFVLYAASVIIEVAVLSSSP